jgi:hypothetical protein
VKFGRKIKQEAKDRDFADGKKWRQLKWRRKIWETDAPISRRHHEWPRRAEQQKQGGLRNLFANGHRATRHIGTNNASFIN